MSAASSVLVRSWAPPCSMQLRVYGSSPVIPSVMHAHSSARVTSSGRKVGLSPRICKAAPAAIGAAIEVPDMMEV